jgi:CubicO group peptidase (beta-lactamase class C family)
MKTVIPEQVGLSSERLARVRTALQAHVDAGRLPGAVTLVARRGQVAHAECFGWRDIQGRKPMQLDTLFPIFSMTKPVLAVAMMILYEEGHYQLSDPLSKFIPAFKDVKVIVGTSETDLCLTDAEREITVYDLLTQTSGILQTESWWSPSTALDKLIADVDLYNPQSSIQEFTQKLCGLPLIHQPGKGWRYGNGPDVLGCLVELISGIPLGDFFKQRIFEPLGMRDTGYRVPNGQEDCLARMYGYSDKGELVEKVESNPWLVPSSIPRGGFGLISTASDYLRFAQMLLNKGELDGVHILGRMTVEYMTRNHLPPEFVPIQPFPGWQMHGYGYGFLMGVLVDAPRAMVLGSESEYYWAGLSTVFEVNPREELITIWLSRLDFPLHLPFYLQVRTLFRQAIVE